jgi:hypothetical protein
MAASAQFTITTTPQKIVSSSIHDQTIKIHTAQLIYVGTDSSVSTTTGYRMDVGDKTEFQLDGNTELWALTNLASGLIYTFTFIS